MKKEEKDESDDEEPGDQDEKEGDADEDGDENGLGMPSGTTGALSDFQYNFEAELRSPSRNLLVKDLMVCFDANTVYGNRAAFMKGIMVTESWLK